MAKFVLLRDGTNVLQQHVDLSVFHTLTEARNAAVDLCDQLKQPVEVLQVVARYEPHTLEVPLE